MKSWGSLQGVFGNGQAASSRDHVSNGRAPSTVDFLYTLGAAATLLEGIVLVFPPKMNLNQLIGTTFAYVHVRLVLHSRLIHQLQEDQVKNLKTRSVAFAITGATAIVLSNSATAAPIILTFEGVGSQAAINNFYNGGTDSQGNSGVNYGIAFGANALALKESDPFANFSREPSPETTMFFLTGSAVLNYAPGFDTGFSFFYSTTRFTGVVNVYDGLNATGNLLGSINLAALGVGPDPANPFSNWAIGSLPFSGLAKSIDFGGTVNQVGYDNITFGSVTPLATVPEPTSIALVVAALGGLAASRSRQDRRSAAALQPTA